MDTRFDALVIGTGQSGPSLAVRLAGAGMKTAIVERKLFGGTCVNAGCVPTKALVASARAAHVVRRASDWGVTLEGGFSVDMAAVNSRKDAIVAQSREGLAKWLEGTEGLTVLRGHARFEGPRTVRVNDAVIEAERIFINVGGRAFVPDLPGLDRVPYFINTSMTAVDFLPEHLVVVGGSYIGLEFAQIYRRFGSRVTVIEMGPRLIGREDEDVSERVRAILENEGVEVRTSAKCIGVAPHPGGVAVTSECASDEPDVLGSHLLLAVGRRPNTDDLGLERAGIATDERGYIRVDDQCRTGVEGVWALGDANGRGAFTHTSYNDYEIVAANLLDGDPRRVSERIPAYALFIDPPLARIGMSERDVRQSGRPALVGRMPMGRVGRARERGETQGFMQVLVDAETQRILGATLLGIEADEVIHLLLDAMYARLPCTVIRRAVHIHPTVAELIPTLLGNLKPLR